MGVVIRPSRHAPASRATSLAPSEEASAEVSSVPETSEPEESARAEAASGPLERAEREPFRPSPPKDPEVRAKLEAKYGSSSPGELASAYDSLAEVLDAQLNRRMQDKQSAMNQAQITALENELGWLAERAGK